MNLRTLYDAETSTYTYLLSCNNTKQAVLIDPVLEQAERDIQVLREMGVELTYILDTHVHADHVTAATALKHAFPQARYGLGMHSQLSCADFLLHEGEVLTMGEIQIKTIETPGHTDNSVSYLVDNLVFTGDALLIRGCGRTDFQSGNSEQLYDVIHQKIFTLPEETVIYPGHDYRGLTQTTVGEEKRWNSRLGMGKTREEFVEIMNGLNLPYPKHIERALPANNQCGASPLLNEKGEPVPQG